MSEGQTKQVMIEHLGDLFELPKTDHIFDVVVDEKAGIITWKVPTFMGAGSEVYGAVNLGRKGIGVELKPSYYYQAEKNIKYAIEKPAIINDQIEMF